MSVSGLRAVSVGAEAHGALRPGREGRVEAVFARSFYLRFVGDWVCVGEASIGRGPLNVVLETPGVLLPEVRPGDPARVGRGGLQVGDAVLGLDRAAVWWPEPPAPWTPGRLAEGLAALGAGPLEGVALDGLGGFVRAGAAPSGRTARVAAPAVVALSAWLAAPVPAAPPTNAVRTLLGLGPGLTPSGDDFLAGALAALRLAGDDAAADALWAQVARHAPGATSALSFAHLRAADRSGLGERLHRLVLAVLAGRSSAIRPALAALRRGDSASPFDALAGCAAALRRVREREPGPEAGAATACVPAAGFSGPGHPFGRRSREPLAVARRTSESSSVPAVVVGVT